MPSPPPLTSRVEDGFIQLQYTTEWDEAVDAPFERIVDVDVSQKVKMYYSNQPLLTSFV